MAAVPREPDRGDDAEAYAHLDPLNDRILAGCQGVIQKYNLPGYAIGVAGKGCVTFATKKIIDYATFKAQPGQGPVRARLAVQHEPRHLHDARAARRSGRCR